MMYAHSTAIPCNRSLKRHAFDNGKLASRSQLRAPRMMRDGFLRCRYTSLPERMGEEDKNASAAVPDGADTPEELHNRDEARRAREKAEQVQITKLM